MPEERLVGGRAEAVDDDDVALAVDAADGEQVVAERVAGLVERKAVDGDADERQGFAVESGDRRRCCASGFGRTCMVLMTLVLSASRSNSR